MLYYNILSLTDALGLRPLPARAFGRAGLHAAATQRGYTIYIYIYIYVYIYIYINIHILYIYIYTHYMYYIYIYIYYIYIYILYTEGEACRGFCLKSSEFAVSEAASKRWLVCRISLPEHAIFLRAARCAPAARGSPQIRVGARSLHYS